MVLNNINIFIKYETKIIKVFIRKMSKKSRAEKINKVPCPRNLNKLYHSLPQFTITNNRIESQFANYKHNWQGCQNEILLREKRKINP